MERSSLRDKKCGTSGNAPPPFETAIAHLKSRGVPFAMEPFDMPARRAAIIVDPDGNKLGIHKRNG